MDERRQTAKVHREEGKRWSHCGRPRTSPGSWRSIARRSTHGCGNAGFRTSLWRGVRVRRAFVFAPTPSAAGSVARPGYPTSGLTLDISGNSGGVQGLARRFRPRLGDSREIGDITWESTDEGRSGTSALSGRSGRPREHEPRVEEVRGVHSPQASNRNRRTPSFRQGRGDHHDRR